MRQRGRRKRKSYTLPILWSIVAIIATVGLIIGAKIGSRNNDDSAIVNAAEHPTKEATPPVTPTPLPTATPTPMPTATPTVTPTPTIEPTPTVTPMPEEAEETQKMVALTFDDGPYPPVTERLLQILKENDSHATFFVMGNRMDTYPDTVTQAFEDGNQIGNHTFEHKNLTELSKDGIIYQVEHSNELINENAQVGDAYLRPPYGAKDDKVKETVKVPLIFWSVDSLDWKSRDKDAVYKEIMNNVKDGDIILMHDLYPSTADAMEKVIPELIAQGYKLVTVKELLEANGITPEAGEVYYNAR